MEDSDFRVFEREVSILQSLRHPNILHIWGACGGNPKFIICEYVERGNLATLLRTWPDPERHPSDLQLDPLLPQGSLQLLNFAIDICRGMVYLHSRHPPIIHRDLKAENFLVQDDWSIQVADFGISRHQRRDGLTTGAVGTVRWMPPEILRAETPFR
eukprot:GFYU01081039.1.p1 GENE.GFYU01081039.1~~GFYU01081039.1.p1  ORF type:complete len:157 (-),score=25.88 GFYU01081039.1:8-478(-)